MGKNRYLGGGTKITIFDKKKNLINKIRRELKSNSPQTEVPLEIFEEYFSEYDIEELEEILEDVITNYDGRRRYWTNAIRQYSTKEILNKKREIEVDKPKKAIIVVELPIEKVVGDLYFIKYNNKNIIFEKKKLVKLNKIELLSPGFMLECHINIEGIDPILLKARYTHKESLGNIIYKNDTKKSVYIKIKDTDLYFEYRCEDIYLKVNLNEFIKI